MGVCDPLKIPQLFFCFLTGVFEVRTMIPVVSWFVRSDLHLFSTLDWYMRPFTMLVLYYTAMRLYFKFQALINFQNCNCYLKQLFLLDLTHKNWFCWYKWVDSVMLNNIFDLNKSDNILTLLGKGVSVSSLSRTFLCWLLLYIISL